MRACARSRVCVCDFQFSSSEVGVPGHKAITGTTPVDRLRLCVGITQTKLCDPLLSVRACPVGFTMKLRHGTKTGANISPLPS